MKGYKKLVVLLAYVVLQTIIVIHFTSSNVKADQLINRNKNENVTVSCNVNNQQIVQAVSVGNVPRAVSVVLNTNATITVKDWEYSHEYTKNTSTKSISRGGDFIMNKVTLVVSFYTSLASECGNNLGITASGKHVSQGMVATNTATPIGTIFTTEEYGNLVVEDRMSESCAAYRKRQYSNYGSVIPVDIYVPRNQGESDYQWQTRVRNMGIKVIKAFAMN